jgi:hypothetical protein
MDLDGRIDQIVDGGGEGGAPAPGVYRGPETDPWTYIIQEDGSAIVMKDGDPTPRKPNAEQMKAIVAQITGPEPALKLVQAEEGAPDLGTSPPDGMGESDPNAPAEPPGESELTEADIPAPPAEDAPMEEPTEEEPAADDNKAEGLENLDAPGIAGTRMRLEDTLSKAAKRYEDEEKEEDEDTEETPAEDDEDTGTAGDTGG